MVQISHLYMTTGEAIALTVQSFVSKVISLPFNMLYRFVIGFLPWSKLSFMATVTVYNDFGAQENNSFTTFTFSTPICHEVMGLGAMILVFLSLFNVEF